MWAFTLEKGDTDSIGYGVDLTQKYKSGWRQREKWLPLSFFCLKWFLNVQNTHERKFPLCYSGLSFLHPSSCLYFKQIDCALYFILYEAERKLQDRKDCGTRVLWQSVCICWSESITCCQCATSASSQQGQNFTKWGNAGRWPPDNLYSASPVPVHSTTTHRMTSLCLPPQHCGCHSSRVAGPARPACSLPGEGTTCQRISSHQSMFLIFSLPVCTSELVYLPWVTFHQKTGRGLSLVFYVYFFIFPSSGLWTASKATTSLLLSNNPFPASLLENSST